jgi:diaminohydroxyphosphoribosylaminopyrimidine deaminase/5-amino-6-(5-phosphoribosylamino)uracil reductase
MVGAVIVAADGRVIGEGWHRRCGQGHAEVNAVASVKEADRPLLKDSTIYVTLEPCSHYGKTPPCAKLIIDTGIPRVVVGAGDPNPKVNGRGIAMLREAGVEVVSGVLAEESIALNKVFFTAQTKHRPFITLKWAQSEDGFMDAIREPLCPSGSEGCCKQKGQQAFCFSSPLTRLSTMKLRAEHEAILTTAATVNADNPRMTLRNWSGRSPRRFILDRSASLNPVASILQPAEPTVGFQPVPSVTSQSQPAGQSSSGLHAAPSDSSQSLSAGQSSSDSQLVESAIVLRESDPQAVFEALFKEYGITSVLVEAGPRFLSLLMEANLWDELRVEIAPVRLGSRGAYPAHSLPNLPLSRSLSIANHRLLYYRNA